jgi:hypothetical protein
MSLCQTGRCCYSYSSDSGATSTNYNALVDGINVSVYQFLDPTIAVTTAGVAANIELFIKGEALPSGVVITKLSSCDIETYSRDSGAICFADAAGILTFEGKVGLNVIKISNEVESLEYLTITEARTGSSFAANQEYNELTTSKALYVSGHYSSKDLVISVGGVEYTQADCLTCGC